MKIDDATWTTKVNMLLMSCDCGKQWYHRSDRWRAQCPRCKTWGDLQELCEDYLRRQQKLSSGR